ncbi:MAG: winged helix-turn-helix transcriptional regulator, partial [Prevotella sp.]
RGVLDTIQKDESTIQKTEITTQKTDSTTQKEEITTQKEGITTQKEGITTQKEEITTQKEEITTQKRVLDYLRENPKATRVEVADALGNITADGVKFIIAKLQQKGLLKRVGGRKHGEWVVSNNIKGWQGQ